MAERPGFDDDEEDEELKAVKDDEKGKRPKVKFELEEEYKSRHTPSKYAPWEPEPTLVPFSSPVSGTYTSRSDDLSCWGPQPVTKVIIRQRELLPSSPPRTPAPALPQQYSKPVLPTLMQKVTLRKASPTKTAPRKLGSPRKTSHAPQPAPPLTGLPSLKATSKPTSPKRKPPEPAGYRLPMVLPPPARPLTLAAVAAAAAATPPLASQRPHEYHEDPSFSRKPHSCVRPPPKPPRRLSMPEPGTLFIKGFGMLPRPDPPPPLPQSTVAYLPRISLRMPPGNFRSYYGIVRPVPRFRPPRGDGEGPVERDYIKISHPCTLHERQRRNSEPPPDTRRRRDRHARCRPLTAAAAAEPDDSDDSDDSDVSVVVNVDVERLCWSPTEATLWRVPRGGTGTTYWDRNDRMWTRNPGRHRWCWDPFLDKWLYFF